MDYPHQVGHDARIMVGVLNMAHVSGQKCRMSQSVPVFLSVELTFMIGILEKALCGAEASRTYAL